MTQGQNSGFEARLRAMLTNRASSVSASPNDAGLAAAVTKGRKSHRRRQWGSGIAAALVLITGASLAATSGNLVTSADHGPQGHKHRTVLLLPLSGTVSASGPLARFRDSLPRRGEKSIALGLPRNAGQAITNGGVSSGPIDVAPSSAATMERVFAHTSSDGVQTTVYDQLSSNASTSPTPNQSGRAGVSEPAVSGCLTTTPLTVEVSDGAAVGTFSEPLFAGATGSLVDVQLGEIGVAEEEPATWVLAQVSPGAISVHVQFANGSSDTVPVPKSGVVVLGRKGTPSSTLGSGSVAGITVLGSGNQTLATYGLGVTTPSSTIGNPPTKLPSPGPTQPSDPTAATAAVTKAMTGALGCTTSPLQRSQDVTRGGVLDAIPDFSGTGKVTVDHVVFTSATSAVVAYDLRVYGTGADTGPLYADATFATGAWQVSLSSVAIGLQVSPPNPVGNVTVAPGGPLFVHSWPDGTAVGVYKALPGSQGQSGYGTGDAACLPDGGVVEEITTPGAVKVLTGPLFPNYTSPLISAAVSTAGTAEGAPATVVGVEVGPQVVTLTVTAASGTISETPIDGVAVEVLAGDPSSVLGTNGSQLTVDDASGSVLDTVPLLVDAVQPAGPSSLPNALPSPGQGPADPQAATQAIDQAFVSVFDCSTPPIDRIANVQDGSLVAGALEELDTGPYEALASSTYITVNGVVFESPTLADVSYTLLFHSDAQLTFPMIGQAVIVSGTWRVSYSTVCAAIQLGLGNCQT